MLLGGGGVLCVLHPADSTGHYNSRALAELILGEEWPICIWKKHKRYYPDVLQWWERCVKKRIGHFFRRITAERNADFRKSEHYYYTCIYDVMRSDMPEEGKLLVLKQYTSNARIVRLHSQRSYRVTLDTATNDKMEGGADIIPSSQIGPT
jgi:hypothetical protein